MITRPIIGNGQLSQTVSSSFSSNLFSTTLSPSSWPPPPPPPPPDTTTTLSLPPFQSAFLPHLPVLLSPPLPPPSSRAST
eukprot:747027-Hanusia_phi.AAC.1